VSERSAPEPGKLLVLGATGGTGREIVRQALAAGSEVTALVRRPEALDLSHPGLNVVAGDVLRPADARAVLRPDHAVLSALGIGMSRAATRLYSAGTGNVAEAMRAVGARRLVCLSTCALEVSPAHDAFQRAFTRHVLQRLLVRPYADIRRMETVVAASGLDWTIVRAARLTNAAPKGRYRSGPTGTLRRAWSVSRADLAGFLLRLVSEKDGQGRTVEIAD
jgi:uncharacterized protein YbjT (DUF2867 family)